MYFGVIHRSITDWDRFNGLDVDTPPQGVKALAYFPSVGHGLAMCVWYAESADSLRNYLDSLYRGLSLNEYFQVDESVALGLPRVPATV